MNSFQCKSLKRRLCFFIVRCITGVDRITYTTWDQLINTLQNFMKFQPKVQEGFVRGSREILFFHVYVGFGFSPSICNLLIPQSHGGSKLSMVVQISFSRATFRAPSGGSWGIPRSDEDYNLSSEFSLRSLPTGHTQKISKGRCPGGILRRCWTTSTKSFSPFILESSCIVRCYPRSILWLQFRLFLLRVFSQSWELHFSEITTHPSSHSFLL